MQSALGEFGPGPLPRRQQIRIAGGGEAVGHPEQAVGQALDVARDVERLDPPLVLRHRGEERVVGELGQGGAAFLQVPEPQEGGGLAQALGLGADRCGQQLVPRHHRGGARGARFGWHVGQAEADPVLLQLGQHEAAAALAEAAFHGRRALADVQAQGGLGLLGQLGEGGELSDGCAIAVGEGAGALAEGIGQRAVGQRCAPRFAAHAQLAPEVGGIDLLRLRLRRAEQIATPLIELGNHRLPPLVAQAGLGDGLGELGAGRGVAGGIDAGAQLGLGGALGLGEAFAQLLAPLGQPGLAAQLGESAAGLAQLAGGQLRLDRLGGGTQRLAAPLLDRGGELLAPGQQLVAHRDQLGSAIRRVSSATAAAGSLGRAARVRAARARASAAGSAATAGMTAGVAGALAAGRCRNSHSPRARRPR